MSSTRTVTDFYTDDITGDTEGNVRPVTFAYGNTRYEIDLSQHNIAALEAALEPFIKSGRVIPNRGARTKPRTTRNRTESEKIRVWGRAQGKDIALRGRIPRTVLEAYDAAHKVS
jgi:hypothetical protein